jgi:hypothetical protein
MTSPHDNLVPVVQVRTSHEFRRLKGESAVEIVSFSGGREGDLRGIGDRSPAASCFCDCSVGRLSRPTWVGDSMAEDLSNVVGMGIGEDMIQRPSKRARRRPLAPLWRDTAPVVSLPHATPPRPAVSPPPPAAPSGLAVE